MVHFEVEYFLIHYAPRSRPAGPRCCQQATRGALLSFSIFDEVIAHHLVYLPQLLQLLQLLQLFLLQCLLHCRYFSEFPFLRFLNFSFSTFEQVCCCAYASISECTCQDYYSHYNYYRYSSYYGYYIGFMTNHLSQCSSVTT